MLLAITSQSRQADSMDTGNCWSEEPVTDDAVTGGMLTSLNRHHQTRTSSGMVARCHSLYAGRNSSKTVYSQPCSLSVYKQDHLTTRCTLQGRVVAPPAVRLLQRQWSAHVVVPREFQGDSPPNTASDLTQYSEDADPGGPWRHHCRHSSESPWWRWMH